MILKQINQRKFKLQDLELTQIQYTSEMNQPQTRIAYILDCEFPTRKAYGVTTRETVHELLLKSIDVKVFSMKSEYSDNDFKKIDKYIFNLSQNKLSKFFINFGKKKSNKLRHISWKLGVLICVLQNEHMISDFNPEFIWLRDSMLAYICSKKFSSAVIIFEVHDFSGKFFYNFLQKYNSKIKYIPINESNKKFLLSINPEITTEVAPMGIRAISESVELEISKYLDTLNSRKEKPIKIGYIGKFAPGGYTKGIEDLIQYAKFSQSMNLNNEITLVGATKNEIKFYNSFRDKLGISSQYLKIKSQVSHSVALELMRSFDALILPKYSSQSYVGMPLKLLEYLASGRITIIADIDLYTKIFDSHFKPFLYTPGDVLSLNKSLGSAFEDKKLSKKLIDGVEFASNFTWRKRTTKILSACDIWE